MPPFSARDTNTICRSFQGMQPLLELAVFGLLGCLVVHAGERPGDWSGNYPPCHDHREMSNNGHMNIGVRFSTSAPEVKAAFAQALDFWKTVIDMEWYEENSTRCAMQIVDGRSRLFKPAQVARSQFPGSRRFQGWIAFNPKAVLSPGERYAIAVHEVGHILGLPHNPSVNSVMYYLGLDGLLMLDAADLAALAARHKLRVPARALRVR